MSAAGARHHGPVVKTIGDGMMGVFTDPLDALRSLAEAQVGLTSLNDQAGLTGEDRLVLKAGLHLGPCVVVTLNGRPDYFGETVNIAARLSALSAGYDLVLSHTFLADAAVRALAEELGQLQPFAASLRGLPDTFELHRLIFAPAEIHHDSGRAALSCRAQRQSHQEFKSCPTPVDNRSLGCHIANVRTRQPAGPKP